MCISLIPLFGSNAMNLNRMGGGRVSFKFQLTARHTNTCGKLVCVCVGHIEDYGN